MNDTIQFDFWKNQSLPENKTEGKKVNKGAAAVLVREDVNRQGNTYGKKRTDLRATYVGRIYCTCWWTGHGEYRKEKREGWVSGFWFWPNEKMMAANPTYSRYRQNRPEESVGRKVKSRFNFRHVWGTSE